MRFQNQFDAMLETNGKLLDTLFRNVSSSEVFREIPETGAEMVRALSDAGALPAEIYITPEAVQRIFFQTDLDEGGQPASGNRADMEKLAAELGITPEVLEESLALGTDIAVSTDSAARHIFTDEGLYSALRDDMRFTPELPGSMELAEMQALAENDAARMEYLDNLFGGIVEDADASLSRLEQRRELVAPYVDQLKFSGFTESQADAHGQILAANAERMASVFGVTPVEWIRQNFAGFWDTDLKTFSDPEAAQRDDLLRQTYGIDPRMSNLQKRKLVFPVLNDVHGKLSREAFEKEYGKEVLPEDMAYNLRDKWKERGVGIKGFIKNEGSLDILDELRLSVD